MIKLLLCLFGVSACFIHGTVAHVGIIDGEVVSNLQKFSYQVAVHSRLNNKRTLCGGGIIDNKFILTAAHCVVGNDLRHGVFVVAGTTDLFVDNPSTERKAVKKIFWPKRFRRDGSFEGDIAVLMLNESLRLPHHRHWKLHLPPNNRETYDNVTAEIAGFGNNRITGHGVTTNDGKLRFAQIRVGSHWITGVPKEFLVGRIIPHGRSTPLSAAIGDSGSLLVYNRTTIGVLCAGATDSIETSQSPGIYVRVSYYLDFIRNATRNIKTDDMATIELVI